MDKHKMEAIKFENVHFSYEEVEKQTTDELFSADAPFSLNGINLTINEGEFVAVLGHNGSGKSTLARLCNGLLKAKQGNICILGQCLNNADDKALFAIRSKVGIVFQNPDNQTVASIVEDDIAFGPENIGVTREEIGERIHFALNAVGMQKYRHSTTTNLSGGQKQRIAIAGVLALKPRIMILDESTAMLDPKGRKEVMDVVLKLNREEGITVLLITHFPEEALLADRVIAISHGKIVMEGKPKDILSREKDLKNCSLTLPKTLAVCKRLQSKGMPIKDAFFEEELVQQAVELFKNKPVTLPVLYQDTLKEEASPKAYSVSCKNLKHVYNHHSPFESHALNGIDLQIEEGSFFGIIGHTGSGKSTFIQYLNGLLKTPTAEKKYNKNKKNHHLENIHLTVAGMDLTDKTTDFWSLRKSVGMVFQYPEYQLFAETVFQDVAFGLKNFEPHKTNEEITLAVKEALTMVGLDYEAIKDCSPFELSGGQKRRVAIAGVLVTKPEILVLDEPAAGLDPLGKEEMMQLLHAVHNTWCKTVIIVSHDMDEVAENCNNVAVFAEGKVLIKCSPKKLFMQEDIIKKANLDLPCVAKLMRLLSVKGIEVDCDGTLNGFADALYQRYKDGNVFVKGGNQDA